MRPTARPEPFSVCSSSGLPCALRTRLSRQSLLEGLPPPVPRWLPSTAKVSVPTLYNLLPGYLPQPTANEEHAHLEDYINNERTPHGWWWNFPKYFVSLMRAWYGDTVSADNEWGFQWLPRITGDHSQLPMTMAMKDGEIRGLLAPGFIDVQVNGGGGVLFNDAPSVETLRIITAAHASFGQSLTSGEIISSISVRPISEPNPT